ncbi:unnamed protein product [Lactuca saligna]|uniref:RING-type domain-containing protein n=1 Tax=Lactuca saligna TaxID=75948 RepID=A0AA35VFJ3_LACSI|nr:unnamed protein product [Lactuca saligna]
MIGFVCGCGTSTTTLVFIICIWVPFVQAKNMFFAILSTMMLMFNLNDHHDRDEDLWNIVSNTYTLSALRFRNVVVADNRAAMRVVNDTCTICLAKFRDTDTVSQINRCRHVFHTCCMARWISGDNFSCPLCRSNMFDAAC